MKIEPRDDGTVEVVREIRRFRFMFDDGSTLDVHTDREGSDVREAVLAHSGRVQIVGVAELPDQDRLL